MPNAEAYDLLVQHRVGLERYSVDLNKKIIKKLNLAEADIVSKIAALPELTGTTFGPSSASRQHLEATLSQVRATAVEAMAVVNSTLETELGDLALHEVEWAAGTYKAALPFATNFVTPAPQLLKAIVTSRPLSGRFIKDWIAAVPDQIKQKVHDAVMLGVMEGESISDITRRIRGTRALNYGDAVLKGTKRGTETLVRTAVNHVSNSAHKAFLDDNSDVFDRYRWISVLDARTTPVCASRAGAVYTNGASLSPIPPAHPNCRSTIAPIVIGEEVEPVNDYAKWLGDQSTEIQKDILGPAKHKLWMDGRVTIDKFVTDAGRPLTLAGLKANDAKAWSRAFGKKAPFEAAQNPGPVKSNTPPITPQTVKQTTKKTIAANKVKLVENAEALAAETAAKAEAAKVLALENAAKAAADAAKAKTAAALARIDFEAVDGVLPLKQAVSSAFDGGNAKLFAGISADIAKASGELADVALADFSVVYGGEVQAAAVKALIEKFDPSFPVYAAKIGDVFHLIEGKNALKAAEALKEPTLKVKFIDASKAIEAAKVKAAALKAQQAAEEEVAKAAAAEAKKIAAAIKKSQKAGVVVNLTDAEIMTIKHEVGVDKKGKKFFKLKTENHEYHSWAARHYHNVTRAQDVVLDQYKGSTYQSINSMLREFKGDREAIAARGGATATKIKEMDAAFRKNKAPADVQAFRGFDIRHAFRNNGMIPRTGSRLPAGFKPEDLVGKALEDDGFMSFSVRERAAGNFANGKAIDGAGDGQEYAFVMETVVPKGTPTLRGTDYEQEMILKSGRYRVTGVRDETELYKKATGSSYSRNRTIVLEVEIIK